MTKTTKRAAQALAALAIWAAPAAAQPALRSGYFLEGYNQRHQLNPAYGAERDYVSMPALGNINAGAQGTVGVGNFLYKTPGGQLTTFMNESVAAGDFLSGLRGRNRINADAGITLLSAGFATLGGYNTVEVNLRSTTNLSLTKELFEFMKRGMTSSQTSYDVGDLGLSSTTWLEIALGHSRRVNEQWRVGGKLKFLIGGAQAMAKMRDTQITMTGDQWLIHASGEMQASLKGLQMPTKQEAGREYDSPGQADLISWDDIDYDSFGLNGGGLAIDLGAAWKPTDGLEVSAALTDLGFIKWNRAITGAMSQDEWTFDGFHEISLTSDGPNQLDDEFSDLGDQLGDFFNYHRREGEAGECRALGATLALGALYTLPCYDGKAKVGFLSTTRIHGKYSWSEGRFSLNWAPCRAFDASLSYAASTFGHSLGWVINAHPKGFNIFLGSDHQFLHITPQFIPTGRANTNISIGISFTWGQRRDS